MLPSASACRREAAARHGRVAPLRSSGCGAIVEEPVDLAHDLRLFVVRAWVGADVLPLEAARTVHVEHRKTASWGTCVISEPAYAMIPVGRVSVRPVRWFIKVTTALLDGETMT